MGATVTFTAARQVPGRNLQMFVRLDRLIFDKIRESRFRAGWWQSAVDSDPSTV
jgi:hypothetical protein